MKQSDYKSLVARGRKAGLSTRDLYAALGSLPPEGVDQAQGHADENGFVSGYDKDGHHVYRPADNEPR